MTLASSFATVLCLAAALTRGPVFSDNVRDQQWHLGFLDIGQAHRLSEGSGTVVAVIDTGVDASHQDLRDNVAIGVDVVPGGAGDGRVDADGHGTAMAALVAAHGHAAHEGVLGIAPHATILPVRISTPTHRGDTNDNARAIRWAVDHGADVIADALAGGVTAELVAAVRHAQLSDVVVVAAAGNRPSATGVGAPASLPGVIAAAAVDRHGRHHLTSVTGPEIVLAAPGVQTMSAVNGGGYRSGTGTSDAAAIIAGAAALVRAKYPDLSAEQVIRRLTETADDRGPAGRDDQYGYGVLDLVEALTAPLDRSTTPARAAPTADRPGSEGQATAGPVGLVLFLLLAAAGAGALAAALAVRRWRQR